MKKRIVVKDEIFADFLVENKDNHCISASPKVIMDRCKIEQVPETWEEFVEISKKVGNVYKEDEEQISFYVDKCIIIFVKKVRRICLYTQDTNVYSITENKTPAQMWEIIKNLIGEE